MACRILSGKIFDLKHKGKIPNNIIPFWDNNCKIETTSLRSSRKDYNFKKFLKMRKTPEILKIPGSNADWNI